MDGGPSLLARLAARWPVYESLGIFIFVASWALASQWIDPALLPSPLQVARAFGTTWANGELPAGLVNTLRNIGLSFAIGSVAGVILGLFIGGSRTAYLVLAPYLYSVYSLPKVALIPLFVVWLGIGPKTIVVVTSIAVALLVAINTADGVKTIEPILVRAARNLGASRWQIFIYVVLPAASGMIFAGLRLAIGQALITGVAGEIVLAGYGLGAMMWDAQQSLSTDIVFLCLVVLAALGVALTAALELLDRLLFPWRSGSVE
jgi:NitT/TauT family transport system permease protein